MGCICALKCFFITGAQPKAGTGLKMQTVQGGVMNSSIAPIGIARRMIQPRPQGFSLKKWVGREKALASAGHVYSLNIPEKLIYMQPAGFGLTEGSNNGK